MKKYSNMQLLATVMGREFRAISTSYAVLLVLFGGIFAYGLLYNEMYAPNWVTQVPLAVVDQSHSALSRQYLRRLDATAQVHIAGRTPNEREARQWMVQGEVQGILFLPPDFEERVYRGEEAVFVLLGTTDAFLTYEALQKGTTGAMLDIDKEIRPSLLPLLSPQGQVAVAVARPIHVSGTALYNITQGYGSYLIPAVLMVILFQTLLMVIGMLTGREQEKGGLRLYTPWGRTWSVAACIVMGRTFVYCTLYALFALFLLGLLSHVFGIPHIGHSANIVMLMIPYLLATSFFGLAASRYFTDAEAPLLMIAFFSVGLIFLSGVSYPLERMPWYWQMAHDLIPAAPGTLAYVKLNSMGASLADVRSELITLWVQTGVYFVLAVAVYRAKLNNR